RALGPQAQAVTAAILEGVHLLFDDVGHFTDGALEQSGALHDRQADALVAVHAEHLCSSARQRRPQRILRRQHIIHAANSLNSIGHQSASAPTLKRAVLPLPMSKSTASPAYSMLTPGANPSTSLYGGWPSTVRVVDS